MLKRCFDLIASSFILIVFLPVMIIISVIIRLNSPGNVIFKQIRIGKNCKTFKILKFRTMYDSDVHLSKLTIGINDPRITSFGRFLRRFKLDELPQLINVIKSDMSLVGPRPEVPHYVKLFPKEFERILSRVKPGITDLASLIYINESDILSDQAEPEKYYIEHILPHKLKLNEQYAKETGCLTDLKILFKSLYQCFIFKKV